MTVTELGALLKGIAPVVRECIDKAVQPFAAKLAALELKEGPAGKDGTQGPAGERGPDGVPGTLGPAGDRGPEGPAGPHGDPGPGGASGEPGSVGPQGDTGPDGAAGRDGRDGLPGVQGEKGLDGKHGHDGIDGKDGLGFDDVQVEHDGERGFTVKFMRGDQVKAFPFTLPIVLDRGVYKPDQMYVKGDGTTWGGSFWIAQQETSAKPGEAGTASRAWRLAVKAGRDGKPGPEGQKGLDGADGRAGRDLTQMDTTGRKW